MVNRQDRDLRSSKRARFTQPAKEAKPSFSRWLLAGGGLLVILLAGWLWRASSAQGAVEAEVADLPVSNGAVRLPVSTFDDGKARFYTYAADGAEVQFFVLKSSDGVIRAAFNACDVCFPDKKGYRQEGDEMVCNNCGQRFPSVLINEVRGGCNPSPLDRTIEGDEVVIQVSDILGGARYF